jgi:ABC-type nitrate/sulfonate/bicarbonate transport system permease component
MSPLRRILTETRLTGWLLVAAGLALWQVAAQRGWLPNQTVPALSTIAAGWRDEVLHGALLSQLRATLSHMAQGYVIGGLLGVGAGVAMGQSRAVWRLLEPLIEILRPAPISALVPLLILFLGIDDPLKITVVAIATFFPIFMNTFAGVRAVSQTMHDTGRTFGVRGVRATLPIIIPAAAPMIFVGLRYAVSVGLVVALVSEMIAGNDGMGYFVIRAQQNLSVVQLFIGVLTLALLGYTLNFLFLRIEAAVLPWQAGSARRSGG